jgi:hypothetical protein
VFSGPRSHPPRWAKTCGLTLKKGTMFNAKGPLPNFERLIEHSALCIEH